jgi:hypothetical protein
MELLTFPGSLIGMSLGQVLSLPFQVLIGLGVSSIVFYLFGLVICHLAERYGR